MSKKKTHKLPRFPEHVIPTFEKLCALLKHGELDTLKDQVEEYVQLLEAQAKERRIVDPQLLSEIASRTRLLLEHYDQFPEKEQRLITGAVRYFLCHDDPLSDLTFGSGLNDDAKVINYVLQEICIEDMFIDLGEHS